MYKGVTTAELDELAAETAASMTATHPDYAVVSRGGWKGTPRRAARAEHPFVKFGALSHVTFSKCYS